jgi:hypothetical protein
MKGSAGMNTCQFLEVATKVFVNQDQEARQEADKKMKMKVDLLTAAFAGQSVGPGELLQQRQSARVITNAPRTPLS